MSGPNTAINLVKAAVQAAGLGQRADPELLSDFLDRRDPAAFEALVLRHGPLVLSACRQVLRDEAAAEDAFQATFVTLYQKAATIRNRPSVAGWLYHVARRSANSARRTEHRRASAKPPALSSRGPSSNRTCRGARRSRSSTRSWIGSRSPIACRWLSATYKACRGTRRRDAWAGRSIHFAVGSNAVGRGCGSDWRNAASHCRLGCLQALGVGALPGGLVAATLAAARTSTPLRAPLGVLPWKAGALLAVAATAVIGFAVHYRQAHAQPKSDPPKSPTTATKELETPKSIATGRVLDPTGKLVAGADVFVQPARGKEPARSAGSTDAQGRFSVPIPNSLKEPITIAATARGFAASWEAWEGDPAHELTLTLAKDDLPVEGRILDLEGKPVAGAKVRVESASIVPNGGPRASLEWLARRGPRPKLNTIAGPPPGATAETTTDAAGKFRLTGIGRDRAVRLLVTGPGIAHEEIEALTVLELDPKPDRAARVFPAQFDLVTAPSRPIRGTVRDTDTGKPVPGVSINAFAGPTSVTTDRDGRYDLPGYKKGPKYTVYAWPPDGSTYFPGMADATDIAGLDPLEMNIKLKRGISVTGRLRDTKSGQPVAGEVRYFALAGNQNVTSVSVGEKVGEFFSLTVKTKSDGSFTCAVLPSRGFLAVTAEGNRYPAARVDPKGFVEVGSPGNDTEQLRVSVGGAAMSTVSQDSYHAIVFLNVDAKKPPDEQAIDLTPTEPIRGRLFDPDGKPLTGVRVRGLNETGGDWSTPLRGAEFSAPPAAPRSAATARLPARRAKADWHRGRRGGIGEAD